jgi:hypothetical protein
MVNGEDAVVPVVQARTCSAWCSTNVGGGGASVVGGCTCQREVVVARHCTSSVDLGVERG